MKRRNEEAECTTEPDRFASNPPKKTLAFWGGVHVRIYATLPLTPATMGHIYAWGGPEESVPTGEGGTDSYTTNHTRSPRAGFLAIVA